MAHAWKACWGQPLTSSNLVSSAASWPRSLSERGLLHDGGVFTPGQVVTVFRSRLRPEALEEYEVTAALMSSLAAEMPGHVDHKTFAADDGERVTVVTFADRASHDAWRTHLEHRVAQRQGREQFYAEFSLQVADVTSVTRYP
jgi:heme-degrading monooxygenase HmoA